MADNDLTRSSLTHYYQTIHGFFWFEEAYRRMLDTLPKNRPSIFVEVGSYKGKSTAYLGVEIVNRRLPCTLNCVDAWQIPNGEVGQGPRIHAEFEQNMTPLKDRLEIVVHHKDSLAAAATFADSSCDVIWIDGDHEYAAAKADIIAWWPKLKAGGYMGGDDFMMTGVAQAVCEQFAPSGYILVHGWTDQPAPMCWPSWIARKP